MELLGQRFGHIVVTGIIGQGGMGEVYSGFDETLERKVALKVIHPELRPDQEARDRLLREARSLSKLDHPNICRIYNYIEGPDTDLLVLEFIDGRNLKEALPRTSRADKVRIAIGIAEVLVTAHRAGILHRDLKPDNVMLTNANEVKVLDFGLARWLHRPRSGPRAVATNADFPPLRVVTGGAADGPTLVLDNVSGRGPILATQAGVTMGTPMFMSPEQARGEQLTAASDMFAFGLLLQVLFTGREPHPAEMEPQAIMTRVATGVTEPVKGAPRDVEALIDRLKQLAPADRPTAVEALERLQGIAGRAGRIVRRSIAAAVVTTMALGGWRYTVDLRHERAVAIAAEQVAVAERAEAVRRRAQAEDLIDFMMGDLHRKLERIGQLDALDAAADRAMDYMSTLRPEMMSAAELARNATALDHLGQVRMAQGKLPDALKSFEQSLLLAHKAAAKEPKNLEVRFTLGQAQFWVGETHRVMGNKAGALENMRGYLATSEALARAAPSNLDYQIELAYGYSNIGSLLEAEGDFAGALQQYERCVAVKRVRLRTDPHNRAWQGDLAQTINKIGVALQQQGRLEEARSRFLEEERIYASLVTADPKDARWKNRLVTTRAYLATLLIDLGELDAAQEQIDGAEALAAELVAFEPQNVSWRRDLAVVMARAASIRRMRGNLAEARPRAMRAAALIREAVRDAPHITEWRRDVAYVDVIVADVLYASGASAAARARLEAVLDTIPRGDPAWRMAAADASLLLGRIAASQNRLAEARDYWNRTADLLANVTVRDGVRLADARVRCLLLLGRDAEARPILDELRRMQYAHPDLMRLPRVATGVSTQS